jgi:hypothetical protein
MTRKFTTPVELPADPTAALQAATKQYADAAAAAAVNGYAPLASPTFTGTVTVPTPAASTAATTKSYVDAVTGYNFGPPDLGLVAWVTDPSTLVSTANPGSGGVRLSRIRLPFAATVSTIYVIVQTAGATLTANQSYAGIYNTSFSLLATTASQSTNWTTVGVKTMALTSSVALAAGDYYCALMSVGTTTPAFVCSTSVAQAINAAALNRASNAYLALTGNSGQTSLPATATVSGTANAYWFGLS